MHPGDVLGELIERAPRAAALAPVGPSTQVGPGRWVRRLECLFAGSHGQNTAESHRRGSYGRLGALAHMMAETQQPIVVDGGIE